MHDELSRQIYWRKTKWITSILLILWLSITFGVAWFARALNDWSVEGFPVGFYMAAQGLLLIYLLIIGGYNRYMRKLDRLHGIDSE